jgi:Ni,Fe-hydrogenase III large subunit
MISGPRVGRPSALRRWLASALARELDAFVVPGREILDALALDPVAAGLRLVANPRHASVLVLAGEIPPELARAAAVAYAQQPRPRAILSIGASMTQALPAADVSVVASQSALTEGVAELRRRLALGAWDPDPPAFVLDEPHAPEPTHHDEQLGHHTMSHDSEMGHAQMGEMDHGHMGGGGFMSMVMMTRDLPRSADGLPMERLEVPFGPLFPGLPGGLNLLLTLDGDTIDQAEVRIGTLRRDLAATWPGPAETFADRLARLDPLATTGYRMLAWRALEQATGTEADEREMRQRIAALERERAASHLSWLGRLGFLVGDARLARRASSFARAVGKARIPHEIEELRGPIAAFVRQVHRTPLLARRLDGVGRIEAESGHDLRGPVARASGRADDARQDDAGYRALGFAPTFDDGCDARARLSVRLAEIEQSLDLMRATGIDALPASPKSAFGTGSGHATVETPRGGASLMVTLTQGQVLDVALEVPSSGHVHLVDGVAVDHELADGLLGIVSLDLSPWELDR